MGSQGSSIRKTPWNDKHNKRTTAFPMNQENQRRPDEPASLGLDGLLKMFPSFDEGVVEMAYANHNHNYERTYAHLVEMDAQIENNANNEGAAEARFSRSDDAPDPGMAKLQAVYPHHIDAERIKFTYNESGRSVEEAAKQLLEMIEVEEESRAKRLRQHACHAAIDNLKDAAFKSTLIKPSEFYYNIIGNGLQEGAVNVHGINTYVAVLAAAIGDPIKSTPNTPTEGL